MGRARRAEPGWQCRVLQLLDGTPLQVAAQAGGLAGVRSAATKLRDAMDPVFSCETVFGDCGGPENPSRGHCFLAAMALQDLAGGQIMSGVVGGVNHYWNALEGSGGQKVEVDITGDQFGQARVQVKRSPIREGFVFPRDRYDRLDPAVNDEPQKIYDRFRPLLVQELRSRGLASYTCHLSVMP